MKYMHPIGSRDVFEDRYGGFVMIKYRQRSEKSNKLSTSLFVPFFFPPPFGK